MIWISFDYRCEEALFPSFPFAGLDRDTSSEATKRERRMRNTKDMKGYHGIRVGQRVYSFCAGPVQAWLVQTAREADDGQQTLGGTEIDAAGKQ